MFSRSLKKAKRNRQRLLDFGPRADTAQIGAVNPVIKIKDRSELRGSAGLIRFDWGRPISLAQANFPLVIYRIAGVNVTVALRSFTGMFE